MAFKKLHLKKGALHKTLGISAGNKIPLSRERKAAHSGSKLERERAQFAINARKWHHEDVEPINELSKKTLGRYVSKASDDVEARARKWVVGATPEEKKKAYAKLDKKNDSRLDYIGKAVSKMKLKESGTLNELSKKTLDSYRAKATKYEYRSNAEPDEDIRKFKNRKHGLSQVVQRKFGSMTDKRKGLAHDGLPYNKKYRAESVDEIFENWEAPTNILEGLSNFLFGNLFGNPPKPKTPKKRAKSEPDPSDSLPKGPSRDPKTGRIAPQNWGIDRNIDEPAVDRRREANKAADQKRNDAHNAIGAARFDTERKAGDIKLAQHQKSRAGVKTFTWQKTDHPFTENQPKPQPYTSKRKIKEGFIQKLNLSKGKK